MNETSPFSSYIGTNYVPSDAEVPRLKKFIKDKKQRAAALGTTTKKFGINAERVALLKSIEDHEKLLAPIRRVPVDVLMTIFLTCLEDVGSPGMSRRHPSVALSHVCDGWRRLALQIPRLWTHIEVNIPYVCCGPPGSAATHYSEWCRKLEILQHKIETSVRRSSQVPIRLRLDSGGGHAYLMHGWYLARAHEQYAALIAKILESSSRWEDLDCTVWFDSLSETLLNLFRRPPENFPILTRMRVRVRAERSPSASAVNSVAAATQSGIFATPSLRSLELLDFWGDIPAAIAASGMPLHQSLENLEFHAEVLGSPRLVGSQNQMLKLLAALPSLVSCSIKITKSPPPVIPGRIPMPNLASFTLLNFPVAKEFAAALDLPSLTALHLASHGVIFEDVRAEENNGTSEFLLKLGHQLQSVTFYPEVMTHSAFSRCIKQLPNVVILKLWLRPKYANYDKPNTYLLSDILVPGICPQLQELEMRNVCNSAATGAMERAVIDFIVMRRGVDTRKSGGARIRKVRIKFEMRKKVDVRRELKSRNVDLEGFELDLEYPIPGKK